MRAFSHIGRIRSQLLLLSLFTFICLAALLKGISYNIQKEEEAEEELEQTNKVMRNFEALRASIAETGSKVQSLLLTGEFQPTTDLASLRARTFELLRETAALEEDPMQQQKFALIKKAIEQKDAFQENILRMDTMSSTYLQEISYYNINNRLDQKIQLPLALAAERQLLLLQRKVAANETAATHARFITIFTAVFIYLLILCALWYLRRQVKRGPVTEMSGETETEINGIFSPDNSEFIGVFSIDGTNLYNRRQEGTAIVRVLWSKEEAKKDFDFITAKTGEQQKSPEKEKSAEALIIKEDLVPEWVAAGLPEELTLSFDRSHDHYLGQAVNANFYQPGPVYNRHPGNYMPGGMSAYRILPAPPTSNRPEIPGTPAQELPGFELSTLIQEVLSPFYAQAAEKNIRLLYTPDPSIPDFLSGDPKKLSGILRNIIDNAIRFTYKGYVQLTVTGMNIQTGKAEIAFSIADTGKGLDSEQMHDLLHGPGVLVPTLYQAKKLAESQQAQLMIHSTEEDGTVCCFIGSYRY